MNVKKGDMAIVVNDDVPKNNGIICNVLKYLGKEHGSRPGVGPRYRNGWLCESLGRPFVFHSEDFAPPNVIAVLDDSALKSVSGLDDPDYTELELPTPAKEKEHG